MGYGQITRSTGRSATTTSATRGIEQITDYGGSSTTTSADGTTTESPETSAAEEESADTGAARGLALSREDYDSMTQAGGGIGAGIELFNGLSFYKPNNRILQKVLNDRDYYFMKDFSTQAVFSSIRPTFDLDSIEDREFLILSSRHTNEDGQILRKYESLEENPLLFGIPSDASYTSGGIYDTRFTYGSSERQRLQDLYGEEDAVLLLSTENEPPSRTINQNSVKIEKISYDSISSLGTINQETLVISSAGGSEEELITSPDERIIDAGGVNLRNNTIANRNVTMEVPVETDSFGRPAPDSLDGTTVTTSGY